MALLSTGCSAGSGDATTSTSPSLTSTSSTTMPSSSHTPSPSATASAARTGGAAARLFATGADICTLVSTPGLNAALGFELGAPTWDGRSCNWESAGGKQGVTMSAHPGLTRFGPLPGPGAGVAQVTVTGASKAGVMLQTIPVTKSMHAMLLAVFAPGSLLVSVSAAKVSAAQATAAANVAVSG